ncbi:MAG: glycosyltransferase [Candidatus Omnitrophota bacterium]|nr:glycosyltransferase [Candidatus Omnitrophota bacterium]
MAKSVGVPPAEFLMLKKTKKVAIFVGGEFIPSFSGAANRFHYLSQALHNCTETDMLVILCDRGWSDIKQIRKEKFKTYLVHPDLFRNVDFLEGILKAENVDILQFPVLELIVELGIQLSYRLNRHLVFEAHYEDYEFAKAIGASQFTLSGISYLQNTFGKYFDKVIALSNEDRKLSKNLRVSESEIAIIPSGANIAEFPENCFDPLSRKIVFLGNLYFSVNLKALKLIKKIIYPCLKKQGFKFYIIGDIASVEKEKLEEKNFIIKGKQANLYRNFNRSTFGLAPVLSGSGMRIKILNYLNAGIPVITTSQGAKGFQRKDLLIIEDDLREYPLIIEKLLKEKQLLKRLSIEGRKFIEENMSWEVIAKKVAREYDVLLSQDVKPKEDIIDEVLRIKFGDPPWIKEVIEGKRFKRNKPYVGVGRYLKIN